MTTWIFGGNVFGENLERFSLEVEKQGMRSVHLGPWVTEEELLPFCDEPCLFLGCISACDQVADMNILSPGPYLINDDCTAYYGKFGSMLLNERYIMLPFDDLLRRKDDLYDILGIDNTIFVRPNSGKKPFTGKAVEKNRFEKEIDYISRWGFDGLIVVSEPRNVVREWRFVMNKSKVVDCSQYLPKRSPGAPPAVRDLAALAGWMWNPGTLWILDICETKDGSLHILEIGTFSCSGLYECDAATIVYVASKVAQDDFKRKEK